MTNIAQTVNVLQAVVLTEGSKMVLTPTYHVYDLYTGHHDATEIYSYCEPSTAGIDEAEITGFDASASVQEDGSVYMTLVNPAADTECPVEIRLSGVTAKKVTARVLAGDIMAHNCFNTPEYVKIADFDKVTVKGDILELTMPACSIMAVSVS